LPNSSIFLEHSNEEDDWLWY